MKNKILLFFIFIISIGLISAQLTSEPSSININKTENINQEINLRICNTETYEFKNISFEDDNIISTNKFNLNASECKNITAIVKYNEPFSGILRLKGFYPAELGAQNITHNINVDYASGLDKCDFSVIIGDSVNWYSNVLSSINLINADTNNLVTTINSNSSYNQLFSSPSIFKYYFTRYGVRFTEICEITSLNTNGLINNPELDAQIPIDIKMTYNPTLIEVIILESNYSIIPGKNIQDILNIKNIGTSAAKNIHLSANEWFSFSSNDFNLEPGESKNIGYTIYPLISNTNDTNKNYNISLKITGNFNEYFSNYNINIPFTEITENYFENSLTLEELLKERVDFVLAYCSENPNNEYCTKILKKYMNVNNNSNDDSQTEFMKAFIDFMDDETAFRNILKLQADESSEANKLTTTKMNETDYKMSLLYDRVDSYGIAMWCIVIVGVTVLLIYILSFVFKKIKRKNQNAQETHY